MPRKVAPYHMGEIPYSSPKIVTATKAKIRKALLICTVPSKNNCLGSDKAGHDL
jgi:hypothetical protein